MKSNHLAELEHSLANAAAADRDALARGALASAWPKADEVPAFDPELTGSVDKALQLIARTLPNWRITLEGTAHESQGNWTCILRESGLRDDAEVMGIGLMSTAPLAMIVALLRVLDVQAQGYG